MAQVSKINLGGVDYDIRDKVLEQEVGKIQPIVNQGTINNAADEEDLTSENNLLKLKDRSNLNGMGYVILRKNKSFAEQVTQANTIYEIRYDFDLKGETITIPKDVVLSFVGGKLSNGTIKGEAFSINSNGNIGILERVQFQGLRRAEVDWFLKAYNSTQSGRYDNTIEVQQALDCGCVEVVFPIDKFLYITQTLTINSKTRLITDYDGNGMVNYRYDDATYGIVTDKRITMIDFAYQSAGAGDSLYIGRLNLFNQHFGSNERTTEQTMPMINVTSVTSIWGLTIAANLWGMRNNFVGVKISTTPNNYIQEIHFISDVVTVFKGLELVTNTSFAEGYITDVTYDVKSVSAVIGADFGLAAEIRVFDNCYQPVIYYDSIANGAAFFVNGSGYLKTAFVWDLSVYSGGLYTCQKDYDAISYHVIPSFGYRPKFQGKVIERQNNEIDVPFGGLRNFFNIARNFGGNIYVFNNLVYQIDGENILGSTKLYNDDLLFGEPTYRDIQPFWQGTTPLINRAYYMSDIATQHTIHIEFDMRNAFTNVQKYGIAIQAPYAYETQIKVYKGTASAVEETPYIDKKVSLYQNYWTIIPKDAELTKIVIDITMLGEYAQVPLPTIFLPYLASDLGIFRVSTLPNTEYDGKLVVHQGVVKTWSRSKKKWLGADGLPPVAKVGTSSLRPWAVTAGAGAMFYDTDLKKPLWSDGNNWFDASGTHIK